MNNTSKRKKLDQTHPLDQFYTG